MFIHCVVDLKFIAQILQMLYHRVWQHRELLVGRRGDREGIVKSSNAIPQAESQVICMAGKVKVKAILQNCLKLHAQQPSLGN